MERMSWQSPAEGSNPGAHLTPRRPEVKDSKPVFKSVRKNEV